MVGMHSSLQVVALSGGIATGKSTVCNLLKELSCRIVIFDADQSVANLYTEPEVIDCLAAHFGDTLFLANGELNKALIRERVFSNEFDKTFVENVFHPRVRKECLALLSETTKKKESCMFVADIPLLFESGFDIGQSANLLVATSKQTQIDRLMKRNTWKIEVMEAVIASQMAIQAKMSLADVVFWNEGKPAILEAQVRRYLKSMNIAL